MSSSANPNQVVTLVSRHSAFLPFALSRYRRQWFLTYPRPYGMTSPQGQRIHSMLNIPDTSVDEAYARRHFWLYDPDSLPYDPEKDSEERFIGSRIHILLDSETPVVKLTGRTRTERSKSPRDYGKEFTCYEFEVLIPDEGLLRQCYYCFAWEGEGRMTRFTACGDDVFWCEECKERGKVVASVSGIADKFYRDILAPTFDRNTLARDSLYYC
ncbi:unnamed protein product [Somion occarium]|uniref:Uncharacterized protein n=1 Tax=Somion occarium TaxID=3059160 RepID=A0ABP1DFR3_9APHY